MTAHRPDDWELRGLLTRQIAERGHAPGLRELAEAAGMTPADVEAALHRLAASHSLLLHPGSSCPWVVHPFALAPGSCWVETPRHGYWANCLYCAFGIAAALGCDACITTRYGGESDTVTYEIAGGSVTETPDLFHFPVPPRRWWDNVIFSCSSFQPFRLEADIDDWIDRHAMPRGAIMPVERLWAFARDWYGDYIAKPWRKRSPDEIAALFARHGLVGDFWELP